MNKIQKIIGGLASGLLLAGSINANAALIEFTLSGDVMGGDATNIFNLSAGDTITATGSFDDSLLSGGTGAVTNLLITVGDLTFDNSMDAAGSGEITLSGSGALTDLTFEANEGQLGSLANFDSFLTSFTGSALSAAPGRLDLINGQWDTSSFTVVPVPAAVWLFGSGLLGLVSLARRKTASA